MGIAKHILAKRYIMHSSRVADPDPVGYIDFYVANKSKRGILLGIN